MNKKIYIKKIDSCLSCPNCNMDINGTRYQCNKNGHAHIDWDRAQNIIEIPEWCPLDDCDVLNSDDFEIK